MVLGGLGKIRAIRCRLQTSFLGGAQDIAAKLMFNHKMGYVAELRHDSSPWKRGIDEGAINAL